MKKLLLIIAIICVSIITNAQKKPSKDKIDGLNINNKLKKRVVTWVCSVEKLSTPRLKIKANVIAEPGKNEEITITSNLDLEKMDFYTYDNKKAITIGVVGSGELFKSYKFDFSGVNEYKKDKGIKVLCYFKGSKNPDATIIVTPLITYK